MAAQRADAFGRPLRGKVLIVDDQEGMRDLLKLLLENHYQVAEADSGAALHQALNHDQPDVVLLDLALPDANGLGLLPAIKQRWPETEVIVLTGAVHASETRLWAAEAVNLGAFGLLSKSAEFNCQELLSGVNNAMERRFQVPGASNSLPPQA
jgi:DNA-binding NtrC family response regulator